MFANEERKEDKERLHVFQCFRLLLAQPGEDLCEDNRQIGINVRAEIKVRRDRRVRGNG